MNASSKLALLAIMGCCMTASTASAQLGGLTNGSLDPFNKNNNLPGYIQLPQVRPAPTSTLGIVPDPSIVGKGAFRYADGAFMRQGNGRWVERRNHGPNSYFSERDRNDMYIELYDSARNLNVRLYANVGMHYDRTNGRWVPWPGSDGAWRQ